MKHSAEWGANKERTAILAKVRRMKREKYMPSTDNSFIDSDELIAWLLLRNERYQRRKGGLGK